MTGPRILALDTTSEFGSLALVEGDRLVEEIALDSPDGFGHVLFQALDALLERNHWTLATVDGYCAVSGPGSFTGVRVGLAAAKGLAEVTGRPVVPLSTLRVLAFCGSGALRAAVIEARRGEVYGGVYDAAGVLVQQEVVCPITRWLAALPEGELEFVTRTAGWLEPLLEGTKWRHAPVTQAPRCLATAAGRLASDLLRRGLGLDPAVADANYVRPSDAELFWKDD